MSYLMKLRRSYRLVSGPEVFLDPKDSLAEADHLAVASATGGKAALRPRVADSTDTLSR